MIVRRRLWVTLAWAIVAVVLVPGARRASEHLESGARIEGSEAAAVDRLLSGPLASATARVAVMVVTGMPSPDTPEGAALLGRVVEPLTGEPGVTATQSYLNRPDSLFLGTGASGTFVLVGLGTGGPEADRLVTLLRNLTGREVAGLRKDYPGLTIRWTGENAINSDLRRTSSHDVRRRWRQRLWRRGRWWRLKLVLCRRGRSQHNSEQEWQHHGRSQLHYMPCRATAPTPVWRKL